jgi:capsular exopolysaccharide synthesis family protein
MTSGPKPPNPSELLGSAATNEIIEALRKQFDIVIFDMPPVVAVTDAQIMSAKVDGTILVVREGVSRKEALLKAKQLLIMSKANVLGAIYKGSKNATDEGYYYYGA